MAHHWLGRIISSHTVSALRALSSSQLERRRSLAQERACRKPRQWSKSFMALPFLGARRMTTMLHAEGGRSTASAYGAPMCGLCIAALGPKRSTKPQNDHRSFRGRSSNPRSRLGRERATRERLAQQFVGRWIVVAQRIAARCRCSKKVREFVDRQPGLTNVLRSVPGFRLRL